MSLYLMIQNKNSVATFIWHIINKYVKTRHPNVIFVYPFSNWPRSQFKNMYLVNFLKLRKVVSNGTKEVVDGIGGTVKRIIWNIVLTKNASVIPDALSFIKWLAVSKRHRLFP